MFTSEFLLLRNLWLSFVNVKVLVQRSAKKIVLVGARAKGEMCYVQMNVNVNNYFPT